jgi:phage baseplate assembly protein V
VSTLLDLLSSRALEGRITGVVTGVVTNVNDPEKLHRVKLKFPWLSDQDESAWARVAAPMAGDKRGFFALPEVNDEVLVAFEHGDARFPYVVGSLWNSKAKPPAEETDKNDRRSLTSRSGHVVRLDDTKGEEKIEILDKTGKNSIVIATKDNAITITADADITIEAKTGKLVLKGKEVQINSQSGLKIESGAGLDVKANGQLNAKGAVINLN